MANARVVPLRMSEVNTYANENAHNTLHKYAIIVFNNSEWLYLNDNIIFNDKIL